MTRPVRCPDCGWSFQCESDQSRVRCRACESKAEAAGKAAFRAHVERLMAERAPAKKLVEDAIASGKPKLVLCNGARKLVFSAGFDGTPYRVTSFDEVGPVGHRDYGLNDLDHVIGEVHFALRNGFAVRPTGGSQ